MLKTALAIGLIMLAMVLFRSEWHLVKLLFHNPFS
jgi:hypothetical protein